MYIAILCMCGCVVPENTQLLQERGSDYSNKDVGCELAMHGGADSAGEGNEGVGCEQCMGELGLALQG